MSVHCIMKVYSVHSDWAALRILVGVLASPSRYKWTTIAADAELLVKEFGSQLQGINCGSTVCMLTAVYICTRSGVVPADLVHP